MNIKTVLVVGGGTMGQMIAMLCAENGYTVHIYDVAETALADARKRIARWLAKKTTAGKLTPEKEQAVLQAISYYTDPAKAAENVDLISESVPEDPELKGKVLSTFHPLCRPETIFTTNTSTLLPSQFADATGRPEKLCALHFHDTRTTNIVDVMPHPKSAPEVLKAVTEFARSMGQVPIVLEKEFGGYVLNNMLMSFINAALTMAQQEVTRIEEIDKSWMGVMHTVVGPFGIMDSIGLDTVYKIISYQAEKEDDRQAKANAVYLKALMDQGKMGMKSGRGFYTYPNPAFLSPEFLK